MRFFIGAVVSTLILSPISVLSMALDTPAMSSMAQVKVQDGTIQQQYPVASTPLGSSLQKRFCIRKCSEEHKLGYLCRRKFISDYRVKKAKNAACPKIKANLQKSSFPSLHTALKFDSPGPYIEWPVKRNGRFWNNCKSQDPINTFTIIYNTIAIATVATITCNAPKTCYFVSLFFLYMSAFLLP